MIVRIEHMRAAGYCSSGAREFAKRHGIDWLGFVRDGIPADHLLATGDAMAEQVVKLAAQAEAQPNG